MCVCTCVSMHVSVCAHSRARENPQGPGRHAEPCTEAKPAPCSGRHECGSRAVLPSAPHWASVSSTHSACGGLSVFLGPRKVLRRALLQPPALGTDTGQARAAPALPKPVNMYHTSQAARGQDLGFGGDGARCPAWHWKAGSGWRIVCPLPGFVAFPALPTAHLSHRPAPRAASAWCRSPWQPLICRSGF